MKTDAPLRQQLPMQCIHRLLREGQRELRARLSNNGRLQGCGGGLMGAPNKRNWRPEGHRQPHRPQKIMETARVRERRSRTPLLSCQTR